MNTISTCINSIVLWFDLIRISLHHRNRKQIQSIQRKKKDLFFCFSIFVCFVKMNILTKYFNINEIFQAQETIKQIKKFFYTKSNKKYKKLLKLQTKQLTTSYLYVH